MPHSFGAYLILYIMVDLFNYTRRASSVAHIGALGLGGDNPIRIQSMTTTNTNDTEACVQQAEEIIKAGGELVRFTTQGSREAENMKNINAGIRADGYQTPLVADVHFNPNVADVAALYCEKVRVNPGNYVDPARKFIKQEYTDEEYAHELQKIEVRFVPFLNICKEHHTAIRIGVNHGSLSDRIRNRYGDTPEGIVESCLEFLRICKKENFHDVVISIKSSNTVVMVRSMRLLVEEMEKEGMNYPLHLGVTEAGEGEDGRIKSAVGIGALLADGIGDTVRVSLTEDPEAEMPVAQKLVNYIQERQGHQPIVGELAPGYDPIACLKRKTRGVEKIGSDFLPVVISDRAQGDFEFNYEAMPDFIYIGQENPENLPDTFRLLVDAQFWKPRSNAFPYFIASEAEEMKNYESPLKFIRLTYPDLTDDILEILRKDKTVVVVLSTHRRNGLGEQRAAMHRLMKAGVDVPVILHREYNEADIESVQLKSAADLGALLLDGFGNGIMLHDDAVPAQILDQTMFGILQAAKVRISKTEYISCPSCGRTLYDLQTTIARIKEATSHLKGLKIGIMGCIVNGPGEMADADYGYVGAGRNQISLYKGKECLVKNIPEEEAVERLVQLIKDNGDWK